MNLIPALLYIAVIALGTTVYFFPRKFTASPIAEILSRLLLGIAMIVCVMNSLIHLIPGRISALITLAVMTILSIISLSRRSNRNFLLANLKCILPLVVVSILFVLWYFFGNIKIGELVPLSGTYNHDYFFYIFSSDWLYSHSLRDAIPTDYMSTLEYSSIQNILRLPRIGSESLVVFLASVSGISIIESFVVVHLIGILLIVYAAAIIIPDSLNTTVKTYYLIILLLSLSPMFLFIYGNMNFATAYGITFMGTYYYFGQRSIFNEDEKLLLIPSAIFLAAMIATYPELLSVVVPASFVVCIQSLFKNNARNISYVISVTTLTVLSSVAITPMSLVSTLKVFSTAGSAVQAGGDMYSYLIENMSVKNFMLLLTTLKTETEYEFYSYVMTAFIVLSLCFCPLRVWSKIAGLIVGCSFTFSYCLYKSYGYGLMKAIEFFAFPISIIFSITMVTMLQVVKKQLFHQVRHKRSISLKKETTKLTLPDFLLISPYTKLVKHNLLESTILTSITLLFASLSIFVWVSITVDYQTQFWNVSRNYHLDEDISKLQMSNNLFSPGDILYISNDLGENPYMVARWVTYFIRGVPLVFAPPLQQESYIYNLKEKYMVNFSQITHVLRKKYISNENAFYQNDTYEIIALEKPTFFFEEGFYGDEGGKRWMSQTGEINVLGNCAESISINVLNRFSGSTGLDKIEVSSKNNDYKQIFSLNKGHGNIEFPLINVASQNITLTSLSIAKSPQELGMSVDSRPLTYSIGKVTVNKKNDCK